VLLLIRIRNRLAAFLQLEGPTKSSSLEFETQGILRVDECMRGAANLLREAQDHFRQAQKTYAADNGGINMSSSQQNPHQLEFETQGTGRVDECMRGAANLLREAQDHFQQAQRTSASDERGTNIQGNRS